MTAPADGVDDIDDLARILGYRGAVDERTGLRELGPDLLVVPFWTPAFCAAIVRAAELVGYASDPDDPVPGHEVSLATISPRLYVVVQDDLGRLDGGRLADAAVRAAAAVTAEFEAFARAG